MEVQEARVSPSRFQLPRPRPAKARLFDAPCPAIASFALQKGYVALMRDRNRSAKYGNFPAPT